MIAARGVVTETGGSTSHAAVVSRALGRPSVLGVGEGVTSAWEGAEVTIDGTAGVVYAHRLHTTEVRHEDVPALETLVAWAEELSPVAVTDAAADVLDLDGFGLELDAQGGLDVDLLAERMRGAAAVAGSMLTSADGARAVVRAGVRTVVSRPDQHRAVLLLLLVQACGQENKEER
jgi:pyruvate,orthophosphate dikinase